MTQEELEVIRAPTSYLIREGGKEGREGRVEPLHSERQGEEKSERTGSGEQCASVGMDA